MQTFFNAFAIYCGGSSNDYWAKGPNLLNNLMGVLIKCREEEVGYIGDIRKMYHTVWITMPDQQTQIAVERTESSEETRGIHDGSGVVRRQTCRYNRSAGSAENCRLGNK